MRVGESYKENGKEKRDLGRYYRKVAVTKKLPVG